jgi:hypothetical protein
MFVGAAGMIVELFVASIMAFVWLNTSPNELINQLAYNTMLIASVSTIVFNANPLLRYDGYYILGDLIEIPNLGPRANRYCLQRIEQRVFGVEPEDPVQATPGERRWFLAFMRLCWQEIIVRHPTHASRAETRRWYRAKKPILDYTVLRLRRVVDPLYKTPGGGVSLDIRIRVRGHWRRQYYPALGHARNPDGTMNPDSHRLIWIEPFWRGPEDAPLGPLHSATSVVR